MPIDPVVRGKRVRFGVFEADLGTGELRKFGNRLKIQSQPFRFLSILLDSPGEIVSREELQRRIWGETIVDFDHSLATAVNKLREVLGDSAENPRFIETMAKRGYRFVAPVKIVNGGEPQLGLAPDSWSASPIVAPTPKPGAWLKWAVPATAIFAAAGAVYWLGLRSQPSAIVAGTVIRRLTYDSGLTTGAAISPDGKLVAYASDRADSSDLDIWVQQVDGSGAVRITDDPADDYDPAFSPDGTQIAFRSERDERGIYVAPTLGGEARLLIPQGHRPSFSPTGQMLMYWTEDALPILQKLFVQPISGGSPTQIGSGCSLVVDSAVWSPDGNRVLFCGACGSDEEKVWVFTLDGRRASNHMLNHTLNESVIDEWLPSPSRLLISKRASDGGGITAVPVSEDGTKVTGAAQSLTFGPGTETRASAASNGRIVFSQIDRVEQIWSVPVDEGGHATGAPKQLTSGSQAEGPPSLSRDGKSLVFVSQRGERLKLYYKDLASGKEREIPSKGNVQSPVFSPDATKIIFCGKELSPRPHGFLYLVSVSGGAPQKIWGNEGMDYFIWDWAPDGSTLLLLQFDKRCCVQQLDLKSLETRTLLNGAGGQVYQAHFSHDGNWITFSYVSERRSRVYVAPFRKALVPRSEWIPVTEGNWDDKPHFSYNERLIYFTSDRDGFRCLWAQRLSPDRHPVGTPFAVYHLHQRRRSLRNVDSSGLFETAVGSNMILFNQAELKGNIWLLEPLKSGTQ